MASRTLSALLDEDVGIFFVPSGVGGGVCLSVRFPFCGGAGACVLFGSRGFVSAAEVVRDVHNHVESVSANKAVHNRGKRYC